MPLRRRLRHLFAFVLLLTVSATWMAPAAAASPETERLAEYLDRLESLGFAGVVLVARGDEVLLARGYGSAHDEAGEAGEAGRPWTTGTVSTVGSITKQFTGAAILKLEEQGELSVDDPITRYFDDVPDDKSAITLHHLLTHTAGFAPALGGDFQAMGRDEIVRLALAEPLEVPIGEYQYSNVGYSLLGAIVEQVSGQGYEEYLRRELFAPAGMYETGYLAVRGELARAARGYRDGEDEPLWGTVLERPWLDDGPSWHLRANGGIHSTAYDMLRWVRALREGRVLSPESLEKLWAPHADEGGGDSFYGYGWAIFESEHGTKMIAHNGGNGIFFADLYLLPEDDDLTVFLMHNRSDPTVERLGRVLVRMALGEGGGDVALPPKVVPMDASLRAELVGDWRLEGDAAGGLLRVSATDRGLSVEPRDARALRALSAPAPAAGAQGLVDRTRAVVSAFLGGDYVPLAAAYGGELSAAELEAIYTERLAGMVERMGELQGFEMLGVAPSPDPGTVAVRFRLDFADSPFHLAYLWDGGGVLRGLDMMGPDAGATAFYPVSLAPATAFEAWELGRSHSGSFRVETAGGETRLVLPGGGVARKIGG